MIKKISPTHYYKCKSSNSEKRKEIKFCFINYPLSSFSCFIHYDADGDDATPGPLTRGLHVTYHGVDKERSQHHKQIVDRQSYYYYIYFYYYTKAIS